MKSVEFKGFTITDGGTRFRLYQGKNLLKGYKKENYSISDIKELISANAIKTPNIVMGQNPVDKVFTGNFGDVYEISNSSYTVLTPNDEHLKFRTYSEAYMYANNGVMKKGKSKNPLQLPNVRGIASGPMGAVELHGMGRQNPKKNLFPHKRVSPKNEYIEQAEIYKGRVIFHNLTKDYYYILDNNSDVEIYDNSFRHIKNYIDGIGKLTKNPHKEYRPIITYKGYTIEDIHESKYYVHAKNGDFLGEVDSVIQAKFLINKFIKGNMTKNPLVHYPKTQRGRPRKRGRPKSPKSSHLFPRGKGRTPQIKYFMLDLYNSSGKLTNTLIGQGTLQTAKFEAEQFSHKQGISKVELSGPYSKRPTKDSHRM